MGLFDIMGHKPQSDFDKQDSFRITQRGEQQIADSYDGSEQCRVLAALSGRDASVPYEQLQRTTGIPGSRMEHLIRRMIRQGMITNASDSSADYMEDE